MRVTFINVGYGDAIICQTDDGFNMLLDGGSNLPQEFAGNPFRIRSVDYLRQQGIRHIDAVMISHIHEDHVCGLEPILAQIPADAFYVPYPVEPFLAGHDLRPAADAARSVLLYADALNSYRRILSEATAAKKPVQVIRAGDTVPLAPELRIKVLAPKAQSTDRYMALLSEAYAAQAASDVTAWLAKLDASSNAASLLLYVQAEDAVFLMGADSCPCEWEKSSLSLLENVNVLKLPHHGQADAVDEEIMKRMPLKYVVTTSSSDRRYNSADPRVYARMTAMYPDGNAPQFLFTDERDYPPYFHQANGFHAIAIEKKDGRLTADFIR